MVFLIWLLGAVFVSWLATTFNRSFWSYFFLSFFLTPILGLIVLLAKGKIEKKCPKCAEGVKLDAMICKHCGHSFDPIIIKEKVSKEKVSADEYNQLSGQLAQKLITQEEYDRKRKIFFENH